MSFVSLFDPQTCLVLILKDVFVISTHSWIIYIDTTPHI